MARTLTASDRRSLIRLASTMPKGSEGRRAILKGLEKSNLSYTPKRVAMSKLGRPRGKSKAKNTPASRVRFETKPGGLSGSVEAWYDEWANIWWTVEVYDGETEVNLYDDKRLSASAGKANRSFRSVDEAKQALKNLKTRASLFREITGYAYTEWR